jgi:hypothetical protein
MTLLVARAVCGDGTAWLWRQEVIYNILACAPGAVADVAKAMIRQFAMRVDEKMIDERASPPWLNVGTLETARRNHTQPSLTSAARMESDCLVLTDVWQRRFA